MCSLPPGLVIIVGQEVASSTHASELSERNANLSDTRQAFGCLTEETLANNYRMRRSEMLSFLF